MTNLSIRIHAFIISALSSLRDEERGQDLIEYAVLAGVIGVGAAVALFTILGTGFFNSFATSVKNCLNIPATAYKCP